MMTADAYRRIATYARARYDETTAMLFDAAADKGSLSAVFERPMRPWLEAMLAKLAPTYTPGELAQKSDAFLLGYLAMKLVAEMGASPAPTAERPEPTDEDRAFARSSLSRGDNETEAAFARRVDYLARHTATARALESRPTPAVAPREPDFEQERADQGWRKTLRDGNKDFDR